MKILQINSHYNRGGAARIASSIHRQLLADGEEAYFAYGRGGGGEEKNLFCVDKTYEVYLSALLCRLVGLNGWWNRKAAKRLVALIENIRPDVIHIHTLHGYYMNFALLFRYLNEKDIPCVWTFHDCHAFVGNCGYFFACDRWREGCGKCPDIGRYPKSQFFDFTRYMWKKKKELFTGKQRTVIVTPSDWLTQTAKQSFFGKYPCLTIPNGIDTATFFYPRDKKKCREKYGYQEKEKLVLGMAVGFGDERKGAKYLLGVAKALGAEVKVILVGWEEKNNAMLEGLTNMVTVPNISDANILAEYYSMADVFVLPSLAENYATVTLEAMACGTPVVGFASGGTPEQLTGKKGIAVETGNQQALNEAVRKAVSGEIELLSGEMLAEKIQEHNSLQAMTEQYKKLYRKLAEEKGKTNADFSVHGNL